MVDAEVAEVGNHKGRLAHPHRAHPHRGIRRLHLGRAQVVAYLHREDTALQREEAVSQSYRGHRAHLAGRHRNRRVRLEGANHQTHRAEAQKMLR